MDEIIQESLGDSLEYLTLEGLMSLVLANHPVVRQADLLPENARQELRLARGAFDPKLEASWDAKNFQDTEYYDIVNTTLKVPTWFPIDPKVSVDRNKGVFLNPENSIPGPDKGGNYRQVSVGVSVPLARGLMIDQRRASVRQAQLFQEITDAERIKMINKILLSAAKDYWDWYYAYYNYRLVTESFNISNEIYRRVKLEFSFGEVAAIDTVQAAITQQNRSIDQQEAMINYKRATLQLSNNLWGEQEEPLEISDLLVPQWIGTEVNPMATGLLDTLVTTAMQRHPELRKLDGKLGQLVIEEKLAKEQLKPRLDVEYNLINSPITEFGELAELQFRDNYKFGVSFEFPLFLRKERAKVKQTQIKIDQTEYELDLKQRQIINSINADYFQLSNAQNMLGLIQQAVNNYKRLLDAELYNLTLGESDLFKINFQQDKLLEAETKLLKLQSLMEKARVNLYWSAGVPFLDFESLYLD